MTTTPHKRFSNNFYNSVTYFGVILAVVILLLEIILFALDFFAPNQSAYLGIVTYILLPPFLIVGLILIPIGAYLKKKKVEKGLVASKPKSLVIDFSLSTHQNAIIIFVIGTVIVLVMSVIGSYKAFNYSESDRFCGLTCHGVMMPEYTTHEKSPHANVKCVDCHVGSGVGWYLHYKMAGARMLIKSFDGSYSRPIPTPVETLRPAKETCQECHWPGKSFSAIQFKKTYYPDDPSKNAPWKINMLLRVGAEQKGSTGIHAHMNYNNDIYYAAEDEKRQKITWIKTKDRAGKEIIYTTKNSLYKDKEPPLEKVRKMDCIDCHNRPSHHFRAPDVLVNRLIDEGFVSSKIPMVKSKMVDLLSKEYKNTQEATQKLKENFVEYYKKNHAVYLSYHQKEVNEAADHLVDVYKENFFPEMKSRWDAYPDNIGHRVSLGCFRCHDDEHKTKEGKLISRDCNSCHVIIEQGLEGNLQKNPDGLEFQHPFEDDGSWKSMNCSDCHTGGG